MKKSKTMDIIFWGVLIFYLVLMLELFFSRKQMDSSVINLIPLKSIRAGLYVYDGFRYRLIDIQVWGNVLIFIPLGIYTMILNKKDSIVKTFSMLFLMSLSVETIQYVFRIGVGDIDDIILNCFGGIVGILIYCLLKKIFKTKEKVKKVLTILSLCVGLFILSLVLLLFIVNYM